MTEQTIRSRDKHSRGLSNTQLNVTLAVKAASILKTCSFDGLPLQHLYATSLPTILTGQWWFDYANHIIYFHDNPSGHIVETSVVPTVTGVFSGGVQQYQVAVSDDRGIRRSSSTGGD